MGNITALEQGSLNGLRRQSNECLVSAYNKGYKDGKNEPRGVEAVNEEDTSDYRIGYKVGYEDGKKQAISEMPEVANKENEMYNKALEDATNFFVYADVGFIMECFPSESSFNLFDLMKKYGLEVIVKEYKKWQEQQKQAEEEIKVGDEVITFGGSKAIVTRVEDKNIRLFYSDGSGGRFDNNVEIMEKTGRNFSAEVEQLLDKLKGDK